MVDASGRGSRVPQWLEALGYEAPQETTVTAFLGYASRLYRLPAGFGDEWKCAYIQAAPPRLTRAGVLFPVEGGRFLLTVMGGGKDYPPTDEEWFKEFAQSLPGHVIHETISRSEPLTPVVSYRATENRRRHFERLTRLPENFLVLGDAACAFNPVYGQGMTTAALGAQALDEALRERPRRGSDSADFSLRFQRKLAAVNAAPWLLATGEDFRFPNVSGSRATLSTRLMHRYMDGVVSLSTRDTRVRSVLLQAFHMLVPPSALFRPSIALRVALHSIRPARRGNETGRTGAPFGGRPDCRHVTQP